VTRRPAGSNRGGHRRAATDRPVAAGTFVRLAGARPALIRRVRFPALGGPSGGRTIGLVGVRPPSGTVTFLFTDIEGSTRRWEVDPEAMRAALVLHDSGLRSVIDAHGGWLFKHTGDGVCAAFGSARAAIDAAVEAQQTLALPVRMGISSGEAYETDGDYFGPVLNRAARVMHAAHGGQVLVAASAAALVDGVDLVDLGEHRLRDLAAPTRLFQVRAAGLAASFPPLHTLDRAPGNLPMMVTSFIGRDHELKKLVELVPEHRLVTLTGVGGVGKTRLAVQVAAELVLDFSDGVWLVELAPVADPDAVPDVVATALGVTARTGTVTDSIVNALAGRRLLLIVDNCEHVLDVVASLTEMALNSTLCERGDSRDTGRARVPTLEARRQWVPPDRKLAERGASSQRRGRRTDLATRQAHGVHVRADRPWSDNGTPQHRRFTRSRARWKSRTPRSVRSGLQQLATRSGARFWASGHRADRGNMGRKTLLGCHPIGDSRALEKGRTAKEGCRGPVP
jgi:class 3 adenylate cyclase